uniref:Uncharacterized protein n=6 Tax=Avena sativa TaxID=4498 RepID=A0ACD5XN78_AVESA
MHIFGSKPMADPLDLVCCDTCQKPVKASQYALHAERCSSRMVNPNSSMGLEEDTDPMEPPKKGRKIKLTGNGNKKVYIKVKAKSQSENKNTVNDFELTNGNANKPLNSTADQRLKAATSYPEYHFRDMPAPLATKMYHSQGNYRLQFELGQLYRESCAEQSHNYASNTSPNSSQVNGLIPCDHSALHGSDNSVTHVSPNKFKPRTKHLDQLPATTSELCSGIPHQLSASGSSRLQASKSQRTDTRVSAVRNESARSRSNKAVVLSSKNTGKKKT